MNNQCPLLMADGRHVTDYRPSSYVHNLIQKQNGITNSYDLKLLLTTQASKMQQINRDFYTAKNSCASCSGYYLPDPNGHVDYWREYSKWIGYGNVMTLGCPVKAPAKVPAVVPPATQCNSCK